MILKSSGLSYSLALIASLTLSYKANAGLVIESWDLATGVLASSAQDGLTSNVVENPFVSVHDTALGSSHAHTDFDLSWSATQATFDFQFSHAAAGVDPTLVRSISAGRIDFTTDSDLLVTLDFSFSYSLPRSIMRFESGFGLGDAEQDYFNFGCYRDTLLQPLPVTGSCSGTAQAILPAGGTYAFLYGVVASASDVIGGIATDDGSAHFTLTAIPEPASFFPLALAAMLLRRRRK